MHTSSGTDGKQKAARTVCSIISTEDTATVCLSTISCRRHFSFRLLSIFRSAAASSIASTMPAYPLPSALIDADKRQEAEFVGSMVLTASRPALLCLGRARICGYAVMALPVRVIWMFPAPVICPAGTIPPFTKPSTNITVRASRRHRRWPAGIRVGAPNKVTMAFTTRMTVVQLATGDLFLHSPIAFDARLAMHLNSFR